MLLRVIFFVVVFAIIAILNYQHLDSIGFVHFENNLSILLTVTSTLFWFTSFLTIFTSFGIIIWEKTQDKFLNPKPEKYNSDTTFI